MIEVRRNYILIIFPGKVVYNIFVRFDEQMLPAIKVLLQWVAVGKRQIAETTVVKVWLYL